MVEFKQEIIDDVKVRFAEFGIEMGVLKTRLESIYDQPFMAVFNDEMTKQKSAVRVLQAQVMAETEKANFSGGKTTEVVMRIEGKEDVNAFKRRDGTESYVSNIYTTTKIDDEVKFGQITLWGDANEMHPNLVIGKTYTIPVIVNNSSPLTMSINDPTDVEISDIVIPDLATVIINDFNAVEIRDMENNISRDRQDPKLVRGTVMSTWMKVTRNDTNMGFLKLVGDDSEETTVVKFSKNADQVMLYGVGSMVYVLGQMTAAVIGDDGLEQYPVGMWGNLIVPMFVIPPELPELESTATSIQKDDGGFSGDDLEGW